MSLVLSALRVATRYREAQFLAANLDAFIKMVETDKKAGDAWIKKFCSDFRRILKEAHTKTVASGEVSVSEVKKVFEATNKAIDAFEKRPVSETAEELGKAAKELHDEVWDAEMFADGQTKQDYGRKAYDDLFEPIEEGAKKANDFFERYMRKYNLGDLKEVTGKVAPSAPSSLVWDFYKVLLQKGFSEGMESFLRDLKAAKK